MDPRQLCKEIAKQLGWDGCGDYYDFLRSHLPEMGLGGEIANQSLIEKIAIFMGWDGDYQAEYGTQEKFVNTNIDKVINACTENAKQVAGLSHESVAKTIQLDSLSQKLTEASKEIENLKATIRDMNSELELAKSRVELPA